MDETERDPAEFPATALRGGGFYGGLADLVAMAADGSLEALQIDAPTKQPDAETLAGDWRRIGNDLGSAIGTIRGGTGRAK